MIAAASRAVDVTMGRYVLRHADRVLGVSEQAADFASRLGGVHADVFYNAITPPSPHPEPIADRHRHLVFVGRMVPGKGWDTFIEAVARLNAEGVEVTGELLGAGADLEAARALIADRNLADRLCAPGRVSAQEVRSRLAGATLVNPTVLSEGFQTTLLEALAERGRVVTFTVPGARLLAEQGHPVVITEERNLESLVNSLRSYLRDPAPLAQPDLIDAWTWPVRAREYARIASTLLSEENPAPDSDVDEGGDTPVRVRHAFGAFAQPRAVGVDEGGCCQEEFACGGWPVLGCVLTRLRRRVGAHPAPVRERVIPKRIRLECTMSEIKIRISLTRRDRLIRLTRRIITRSRDRTRRRLTR